MLRVMLAKKNTEVIFDKVHGDSSQGSIGALEEAKMRFKTSCWLLAMSIVPSAWAQTKFLDQGWDTEQREEFYYTAQGSQLIPSKWFLALEQADDQRQFRDDENIRKYGFLPAKPSKLNPDGLPIGFVRDGVDPVASKALELEADLKAVVAKSTRFEVKRAYLGGGFDEKLYPQEQESWFGLTCAACHTHELEYQGVTLRIDGGASQADIESFLRDLGLALDATAKDTEKLGRFATRVGRTEGDLNDFKQEVQQIADAVNRLVERNKARHPYGFARLDAFGAILNAICETALYEPANRRECNAPVSYPSLWNTPDMAYVQWNASADFPEARNVGEVLGVFGNYTVEPGPEQFDSTVRLKNLIRLEHGLIAKLRAPDWPEDVFGELDTNKIEMGKRLFAQNCQSCHAVRGDNGRFARNSAGRIPIHSQTIPEVGTDPQFLMNLSPQNSVLTGSLRTMVGDLERVPRTTLFQIVVQKIIGNRAQAEGVDLGPLLPADQPPAHPSDIKGVGYISRPLEGIWASPPYFHNGSVPNLHETLLPASERSVSFWVGTREFDPVNVGFVTHQTTIGSKFEVMDDACHAIIGNSNAGHEGHGANATQGFTQTFENGVWRDFTEEERYALIEYMKSLSSRPYVELEAIPAGEAEGIANIVELTGKRMQMQYDANKRMLRGVHPKDHGCVTAKFEVRSDLPAEYTVGVFQPGAVYDAYIRFSNADVQVGADSRRDESGTPVHGSRGMAIKLMGVQGESLLPLHGVLTQDFVMVNQPAFAFANVEDYELLSQALVEHFGEPNPARNFFVKRFSEGTPEQKQRALRTQQIVKRISANAVDGDAGAFEPPPASPVDAAYFSAAPFLFGDQRVMRFRAAPVDRSTDPPNVDDPNYLRTALIKRLARNTVEFDFALQVRRADQVDVATDIENASTEWSDDYTSVARITIPPQEFDAPEQRVKCERLFFTPWHGISEHQPLGGINRLRKAVYLSSGQYRNLPKEP